MTTPSAASVPVVNLPNALTVLRLAMVPVFGWMLLSHPQPVSWRWATTLVFLVALATDLADGKIARKYNLVTNFGKLWDPIADKAITGMAFIGLSVLAELPWWVTIVILVREWGITLLRFVIIKYGVMAANRGGKAKTMAQTIALFAYLAPLPDLLHWPAVVLMGLAFLLTVLTGLDYLREAYKLRQSWLARQTADPA
ncbi:MAG: CDP-diacylglycerol--glycerol-3-phosphate 3-phosphatidyltransferase [Propionibacteriaceae bacterium]|jgi:CDP-diacylglycerol--glycerol-3-phosphate 3-phosphatidyltransferase|nr:CDP-diacylglycerol--glycerol-3-phosphate 3-phosphatidyltransferase [Propionibacteriaceae bacterium]